MLALSRREFRELAPAGKWCPIALKIPLEAGAPELFEALSFAAPSILLESARIHPVTGRYSFLVGDPSRTLLAKAHQVTVTTREGSLTRHTDPMRLLEEFLREKPALRLAGFPPFVGGAVGFLGFDAYRYFEEVAPYAQDDLHLPDVGFIFCDEAVILDHALNHLWVIALAAPGENPDFAYDEAVARVETLLKRVMRSSEKKTGIRYQDLNAQAKTVSDTEMRSTHTRESFEEMVRQAKRLIGEGEIYQANLSQRFSAPLSSSPWGLYERLRAINPSPFAAFADFGEFQIISASPERFLRTRGDRVETRPIAGTRPQGDTLAKRRKLRRELLLNEKERAEHLMLVDLERNDLGRIARYGSVEVDTLMELEEYSHVIHIISNVRGLLREGVTLRDLMAATFPGGTITGCPKVRCLEILEMLEPVRRQLYTGSLGYVSYTGDMDMNLLIRTAFVSGDTAHFHAGAGIVADSDPTREYEETLHKAQALFLALHAESRQEAATAIPT